MQPTGSLRRHASERSRCCYSPPFRAGCERRGELQKAFRGWEGFRCTKAIDRIRHRLPLGASSDLLQDGLGGSTIATPQLQKSLQRRRRVVLVVVVSVGKHGLSLLEEAIHDACPPQ